MFSKAKPKSMQDEKPARPHASELQSAAPPPAPSKRSSVMKSGGHGLKKDLDGDYAAMKSVLVEIGLAKQ